MRTSIPLILLCFGIFFVSRQVSAGDSPNVVVIMADDLGYQDLGCYGHPEIKTPVLDQLAKTGVRLTSFYCGATVCTPSRMALMTGAYPPRLGWTKGVVGYMINTRQGLSPQALTMAEVFKSAGYATCISGKWHLGDAEPFRPHRQGFDRTYYTNKSNNQTTQLWRGDEVAEDPFDNRRLTAQFTREAIRFIDKHHREPFFLYVPYTAPHFPVEAHPDFEGHSTFGVYGDVVEELDARIGSILGKLEEKDLTKKTIVVFLSDNGPQPGEQALANPYRGMKWDALEGGTRVPCIVSWPGVLPAGRESDALIAAIDLLPTLSKVCGVDLHELTQNIPHMDGVDVWDTLLGKHESEHPRKDLMYWHGSKGFQAIRVGDWKLFPEAKNAKLPGGSEGPALFHLKKDPSETVNLASQYPDRVKQMQALAKQQLDAIMEQKIPLGESLP